MTFVSITMLKVVAHSMGEPARSGLKVSLRGKWCIIDYDPLFMILICVDVAATDMWCFRWPTLRRKTSKSTSIARVRAMNWSDISVWFRKYVDLLESLDLMFKPDHIWNIDEHGVEHSPKETIVIGEVGRPSRLNQAAEKSFRSTMLTFINAAGVALPPMVIHKGTRVLDSWKKNMPQGKF